MKRLTIFLWLCVSLSLATITVEMSLNGHIHFLARHMSLSEAEVQFCFDEADVTLTDIMEINHLLKAVETSNINNSGLRVGCMMACVLKKQEVMVGTHINIEELRKVNNYSLMPLSAEKRFLNDLILNICIYQVKDLSNECEIVFKLTQCNSVVQDRLEKIFIQLKNSEKDGI